MFLPGDPRPDLVEDSDLWEALLDLVGDDPDLWGVLHGFRCAGLRIVEGSRGFVLRPRLPSEIWQTEDEYKKDRERWLLPRKERIAKALARLSRTRRA